MGVLSRGNRILAQIRSWWRAAARRDRLESDMESELAHHVECMADDLVRRGVPAAVAARRARAMLGSSVLQKEKMRASLGLRWWDELRADLRYASRMLRKSPGFTIIAAGSLALAIGANTTIFSFARQVLFERLAVPHADDLRLLSWNGTEEHVAVHSVWGDYEPLPGGLRTSTSFSYAAFEQLRAENRVLEDLFAFKRTAMNATIHGTAQRIRGEMVSGNYYAQLGIEPVLGRGIIAADDDDAGRGLVAVISYGLWEREFERSPAVLGQVIRVNETPLTIVGVNPKEFTSAREVMTPADVIMPIHLQPQVAPLGARKLFVDPDQWWVNVMGRARKGVSDTQAQAALDTQLSAVVRGTMAVKPDEDLPRMILRDGSRGLFEQRKTFARPMAVLMTFVVLVLLLACANVANLMLARGAQRQREMSVRLALGAGRRRILRQMLVESLLLAAIGGAGGLLAAYLGRNGIPKMIENSWEQTDLHVHFDWRVFAFTATITALTGILFGVAPAVAAARFDLNRALKESPQGTTRRRRGMSGRALVGFQIALATLLVIGAGLFVRTLAGLNAVDVGFRTDHLLLFELNPQRTQYPPGKDVELHRRLQQAIAAIPGVEAVTVASVPYIADDTERTNFEPEGSTVKKDRAEVEYFNVVADNFFETEGIPIVAGRGFLPSDTAGSPRVGVINQSLARRRFPNQSPVGRRFSAHAFGGDEPDAKSISWIEIVGVCKDNRYASLRSEPPPQFFLPFVQQKAVGAMTFEIRSAMKPEAILPALRKVVREADPDLPMNNVRTQDQQIAAAMQQERVFVVLTSGFGLLALALASVGIYGVVAYSVVQRTNEIGIRLALGAKPSQVKGMILRESSRVAVAGVAAGLIASIALARTLQSLLFGIRANDPFTLLAGVAVLLLIATAAGWIPARRAAGVQPMEALRHE